MIPFQAQWCPVASRSQTPTWTRNAYWGNGNSPVAPWGIQCPVAAHGNPVQLWISRTSPSVRYETVYISWWFWGVGDVTFALLVSSSAIGILHCLSLTLFASTISLVLQALTLFYMTLLWILAVRFSWISFLSFKSPKLSIFPHYNHFITGHCLICPSLKSFQVIFLIYCNKVLQWVY